MALATTNITTTIARNALGETINNVGGLCTSTKVNGWSLHKPADYGSGIDTWKASTVIPSNLSGFVPPIGRSSDANGHRLGDFRGYNHTAREPRYFAGNITLVHPKYTALSGSVPIYRGEMYPTKTPEGYSDGGFIVAYHTHYQTDGTTSALGVQLTLNGSNFGSVKELAHDQGTLNVDVSGVSDGTYTLGADYHIRPSTAWSFFNHIEGGDVTLTIVESTVPSFTITSISIVPSTVFIPPTEETSETHTTSIDFRNDTAAPLTLDLYWSYYFGTSRKDSGQINITIAANATLTEDITFNYVYPMGGEGTYKFVVEAYSIGGDPVDGGTVTVNAT